MAQLVLKGHATRGKEVINLLKTLGAKSGHVDTFVGFYYFIECGRICSSDIYPAYATIFTIEEFLEKYPYKVGDEVEYKSIGDANLKSKIIYMEWNSTLNKVLYTTEDAQVISTEDIIKTKSIPPYMDYDIKENIEKKNQSPKTQADVDKYLQEHSVKNGMNVIDIETCLKMDGLKLPENVVINSKGIGSIQFIQWYEKPQYPKTYKECCEVLMGKTDFQDFGLVLTKISTTRYEENRVSPEPPHINLINNFYKLLICRDAYWKIAGDELGLDKPWKPDYTDDNVKYIIGVHRDYLDFKATIERNYILIFPTKEMRDTFHENFKDLIEDCKELL